MVTEMEANTLRAPELDAEAAGPRISEFETVQPALEMGSQGQMAELEGRSKHVVEM